MLHWNGSAWSKVPRSQLKLTGSAGELSAITVVSAKDAWAAGFTGTSTTPSLLLHWNGTVWGTVTRLGGRLHHHHLGRRHVRDGTGYRPDHGRYRTL